MLCSNGKCYISKFGCGIVVKFMFYFVLYKENTTECMYMLYCVFFFPLSFMLS